MESRYHQTSHSTGIKKADRKTDEESPGLHVPYCHVSDRSGVPIEYTHQSSNGNVYPIQKAQLNKYRLRPALLNEHVETSREVQAAVASGLHVGQFFKASQDNINGCMVTLESSEGISLDDFESYADSAALQAAWVESINPAILETVIVHEGSQSMRLPLTTNGDEWVKTIASADFTNYIGEFAFYQTVVFGLLGAEVSVFIGDGTNTKSFPITFAEVGGWNHIEVPEAAMVEDGGGTTNAAAIIKIGFRVVRKKLGAFVYIDNLAATPPPGSVSLELWNMGSVLPEAGVTSLNDGTQITELGDAGIGGSLVSTVNLSLLGGKRLYTVKDFAAGLALEIPGNETLVVGEYYALLIKYVDTDVNVFGPNTAYEVNYYENGYAFTCPDYATPVTALGPYNDCMFGILSTQDVWLNTLVKAYNAAPGAAASENLFIEDRNMVITDIAVGENQPFQSMQVEFRDRSFHLPKGGKFEVYHNDDYTDSTSFLNLIIGYIYEKQEVNG